MFEGAFNCCMEELIWLIHELWKKVSRLLICLYNVAFPKRQKWIPFLSRALLICKVILELIWLIHELWGKVSRLLICLYNLTFPKRQKWIPFLSRAFLICNVILEEQWLWYGAFCVRPLEKISWTLNFIRKVRLEVLASWLLTCSNVLNFGYIPGPYKWGEF
jgi:hypothetical protein